MTIEKEAREIAENIEKILNEACVTLGMADYDEMESLISKALKAKQDRIEELENELRAYDLDIYGADGAKEISNMRKRIEELESALKELIEASKVAYTPKLVQSYAMKSLLKAFKRAKKATGGGK